MNKRRKLNLSINTKSIQKNYNEYNNIIRYYRRKFNYKYYIDWWGKCKLCKIDTYKKHKYYYYCKDCQHNKNNNKNEKY
jgi:hypothetical protein